MSTRTRIFLALALAACSLTLAACDFGASSNNNTVSNTDSAASSQIHTDSASASNTSANSADTSPNPVSTNSSAQKPSVAAGLNANSNLESIRAAADAAGCSLAVACLGSCDAGTELGKVLASLDTYTIAKSVYGEFQVDHGGDAIYCIVATDPNAAVIVSSYDASANNGKGGTGDVRYLTNLEGGATIVKCAGSGSPDLCISLVSSSNKTLLEYAPVLQNGSLSTVICSGEGKIFDFSL